MRLFGALDVCAQLLLLFAQGRLLLAPHRARGEDHHERLVACLLTVRRAARRGLVFLALERAVLLAALAALLDRRDALCVIRLGFLARPEDVILGDERLREVPVRRREERLLLRLERRELALRCTAAPALYRLARGFDAEVVEEGEVGRCEDLGLPLALACVWPMIVACVPWL